MNMGYISDTARNRTHNLFRPKREPIPLGHNDGDLPRVQPHRNNTVKSVEPGPNFDGVTTVPNRNNPGPEP